MSGGIVLHAGEKDFDSHVRKSDKPVLVDFWAGWCGPCKALAPILEEFAKKNPDIKVAKVDIEENTGLAAEHHVMSIPFLVVYKDGKIVGKKAGAMPLETLESWVKSLV